MAALTAAVERLSTSDRPRRRPGPGRPVWLPEVYAARAAGAADDWTPTLGTDVRVLPGAAAVLKLLAARPDTRVAVASRSARPEWPRRCSRRSRTSRRRRCTSTRATSGRTCGASPRAWAARSRAWCSSTTRATASTATASVRRLGVLAVHCPQGLDEQRWRAGLAAFERARGKVIDAPGGPSSKPTVTLPAVSLAMVLLRRPFILFALLRRHRAPRHRRDAPRSLRGAAVERLQDARDAEQRALRAVRGPARRRARRHEGLGQRVVEALAPRGRGRPPARLPARRRGRGGGRRGDAAARVLRRRGAAGLRLRRDRGTFGTVVSNAKWFPKPGACAGVVDLAVPADLVGGAAAARQAAVPAIDTAAAPRRGLRRRRARSRRPGAAARAAEAGLGPGVVGSGASSLRVFRSIFRRIRSSRTTRSVAQIDTSTCTLCLK